MDQSSRKYQSNTLWYTVEPVLEDHPMGHKNVVSQDRWSLVTGLTTMKCMTLCQEYLVFQDRWSLMAVVFQDRFYCITCESTIRAT